MSGAGEASRVGAAGDGIAEEPSGAVELPAGVELLTAVDPAGEVAAQAGVEGPVDAGLSLEVAEVADVSDVAVVVVSGFVTGGNSGHSAVGGARVGTSSLGDSFVFASFARTVLPVNTARHAIVAAKFFNRTIDHSSPTKSMFPVLSRQTSNPGHRSAVFENGNLRRAFADRACSFNNGIAMLIDD